MSYGLSFRDISVVRTPEAARTAWGTRTLCASRPEYHLERLVIRPGACVPARYYPVTRSVYFVEEGEVVALVRGAGGAPSYRRVDAGGVVGVDAGWIHGFRASAAGATVYQFAARPLDDGFVAETPDEAEARWRLGAASDAAPTAERTSDVRDKYWGKIETITSEDFAGKRIRINQGGQASMEFHVRKTESYFVHTGKVRVGLRTGRAENRSIVLSAGQAFDVTPGVMHMRMALEDTLIIEVSTRDDDGDSHLVEDGTKYKHVDIEEP